MKALLGELGKKFLRDKVGAEELRRFATEGKEVSVVIVNGEKYVLSTKPLDKNEVAEQARGYTNRISETQSLTG